ncbi:hypothetical protein XMM354_003270 [Aliiroseovarius sp. xm-m-354]|nr:hypothetical protein [Aliiroseovarius sp. xm-m-354]
MVARRPIAADAHLDTVGEDHRRPLGIGLGDHVKVLTLKLHVPVAADLALVVVHPAGDTGAADFADAVHGGTGGGDAAQLAFWQGNALKTLGVFFSNKGGGHLARDKLGVIHYGRQERKVMSDPLDLKTIKRHAHLLNRLGPGRCPSTEFGDHWVVIHRNFAALIDAGIVTHGHVACRGIALPCTLVQERAGGHFLRRAVAGQTANRGQEAAVRVLGIKSVFDGPAGKCHIVLGDRQFFAIGDADHLFD